MQNWRWLRVSFHFTVKNWVRSWHPHQRDKVVLDSRPLHPKTCKGQRSLTWKLLLYSPNKHQDCVSLDGNTWLLCLWLHVTYEDVSADRAWREPWAWMNSRDVAIWLRDVKSRRLAKLHVVSLYTSVSQHTIHCTPAFHKTPRPWDVAWGIRPLAVADLQETEMFKKKIPND